MIFLIAGITDQVDGFLARRWHVESAFGKIADPLADRLMIGIAVILEWHAGRLPLVSLLTPFRDLLLMAVTPYMIARGYRFEVNTLGKAATWLLYLGVGCSMVTRPSTDWPLWIFWTGFALALASLTSDGSERSNPGYPRAIFAFHSSHGADHSVGLVDERSVVGFCRLAGDASASITGIDPCTDQISPRSTKACASSVQPTPQIRSPPSPVQRTLAAIAELDDERGKADRPPASRRRTTRSPQGEGASMSGNAMAMSLALKQAGLQPQSLWSPCARRRRRLRRDHRGHRRIHNHRSHPSTFPALRVRRSLSAALAIDSPKPRLLFRHGEPAGTIVSISYTKTGEIFIRARVTHRQAARCKGLSVGAIVHQFEMRKDHA